MFRPLENDDALIRNFDTVIARSAADLAQAYRVRYQVYCVENTFEDPADNPGGLERDLFDERASHCLLVHRPSGAVAGTVRLVLPDRERPHESFTLQHVCAERLTWDPERFPIERMAEISRFCISKAFRKRLGNGLYGRVEGSQALKDHRRLLPHMTLGLIEGLVRMSVELGIDYWCAVMEPGLLRLLTRLGIHFDNIGPVVDYHGKRQPCYQRLDRLAERVRAERPDLWDILTDDGRHWQALQARWGGDGVPEIRHVAQHARFPCDASWHGPVYGGRGRLSDKRPHTVQNKPKPAGNSEKRRS